MSLLKIIEAAIAEAKLPIIARYVEAPDSTVDDEIVLETPDGTPYPLVVQIGTDMDLDYLGINLHSYDAKGEVKSSTDIGMFDIGQERQLATKLVSLLRTSRPVVKEIAPTFPAGS